MKKKSPEIMDELSLGFCDILGSSIFSSFDCNNMKYGISSQILYHVIPPGYFCHPCNTDLPMGL